VPLNSLALLKQGFYWFKLHLEPNLMADAFSFLIKMSEKCTRFYEQHSEKLSASPFLNGVVNWVDKFISISKEVMDCVD
jgi:hypothetical protein